jgi:hypothetical protein
VVEYGNGVSQVAGNAGGGANPAGQSIDLGASVGQFVANSVHTISTMPPAYLLVGVVVIVLGLILLKRAF